MRSPLLPLAAAAVFVLAGCAQAPRPLYGWGGYQGQLYAYFKGTDSGLEQQIAALEADLQHNRAADTLPPPGFHAHLGLLYANLGRDDAALHELQTEKALFPESAHYVDFLLTQAQKKKGTP